MNLCRYGAYRPTHPARRFAGPRATCKSIVETTKGILWSAVDRSRPVSTQEVPVDQVSVKSFQTGDRASSDPQSRLREQLNNRFITPDAQMVLLSGSVLSLDHTVAFYNPGTQKVTWSGTAPHPLRSPSMARSKSLRVEVTSISFYQTNVGVNLQQGPAVPMAGGRFQLTVSGDTFFSLD